MIENGSLWSRIGQWMNSPRRDETLPELTLSGGAPVLTPPGAEVGPAAPWGQKEPHSIMPWRRRDEVLERLQGGYEKVIELVGAVQDHLVLNNKRSDQMAELLKVVGKGVQDVPNAMSRQADTLASLVNQIAVSNRQNRTIVDTLSDLPRAAQGQKEAMDSIATQVQASSAVTEKLSDRLESIGDTVKLLGETLSEQIRTLKVVQQATRQHEAQLSASLDRQSRRFGVLIGVTLTMACASIATACISLFT